MNLDDLDDDDDGIFEEYQDSGTVDSFYFDPSIPEVSNERLDSYYEEEEVEEEDWIYDDIFSGTNKKKGSKKQEPTNPRWDSFKL